MTDGFQFHVDRGDISRTALQPVVVPALRPGEALFEIEGLALSANTLTYAATGDALGYWKYFPLPGGVGMVPTWGLARVIRSRCDALPEGGRWFGFLPLASHLVVTPKMHSAALFSDAAPHLQGLPANYKLYRNVGTDPHFLPGREAECALLRPLVMLSFLIVEQLKARGLTAADQVMLTSASSKAALSAAYLGRQAGCGHWTGLTSAKHAGFVRGAGAYDTVATYDAIDDLEAAPCLVLDISGNASVRSRIEARWARVIEESLVVGATHWEASQESFGAAARTKLFFAPDVMKASIAASGAAAFEARFLEAWHAVLAWTPQWLSLDRRAGTAGLASAYEDLLAGVVPPRSGLYVTLTPERGFS